MRRRNETDKRVDEASDVKSVLGVNEGIAKGDEPFCALVCTSGVDKTSSSFRIVLDRLPLPLVCAA
jgi:hypothetical protein